MSEQPSEQPVKKSSGEQPVKKSSSANATEAPTSARTNEALEERINNKTLTIEQQEFVILMSQYYAVHGEVMPLAEAVEGYGFGHNEFVSLITSDLVLAALSEWGLNLRSVRHLRLVDDDAQEALEVSNSNAVGELVSSDSELVEHSVTEPPVETWQDRTLSPVQLIVANTMLDLVDTRSQKKKLQDLGISTQQYSMWLKDPVFSTYLRDRAESMLGENQHEAHLALLDKIRLGDLKAIQYYNEMTGRYVQQSASSTGTNSVTDFKALLVKVLEIINDEVDGPQALRIGEKLRGLIGAHNTATALMDTVEPIEQPKIAATRTLSPRLQELMDKGTGDN